MANAKDTASWVRWVMGFLILAIIGMASYMGTALATERYHNDDVTKSKANHDALEAEKTKRLDEREAHRDYRQTVILEAIDKLEEAIKKGS